MTYRNGTETLTQRSEDELLLINLRTNRIFIANVTGARIWDLLLEGHDLTSIERVLVGEGAADGDLAAQTESFVRTLLDEGLLSAA
jgi:hypothetical protein